MACAGLLLCLAASAADPRWLAAWGTAARDIDGMPVGAGAAPAVLQDLSLRQQVPLSVGGGAVRVRFSNLFGTRSPLHIAAATIAPARGATRVDAARLQVLRFGGSTRVDIPAGSERWSDPVAMDVHAGQVLAVSFHLDRKTYPSTVHGPGRGATRVTAGNAVARADWDDAPISPWSHAVTAVDVASAVPAGVLVAFGDSITEGNGVPGGPQWRYPELLGQRLRAEASRRGGRGPARTVSVLNAGISGNRLLADGAGQRGLDRFDRDVLAQSGATHVLILIGINDIGYNALLDPARAASTPAPTAAQIQAGLQQLIDRAAARGVRVLLGTLLPFGGAPNHNEATEATRSSVNTWIRANRSVRGVVDFDAALRDPKHPLHLAAVYDSGDHLHPSPAGYREIAKAVPLRLLD